MRQGTDLETRQKQFRGRRLGELILHYRRENNLQTTIAALHGVTEELPPTARPLVESWIDEMNPNSRCGGPYLVEKWLKAGPIVQCPNAGRKFKRELAATT